MNTTTTELVYLTPEEVSERYKGKVSVRTLANWRWAGTGPKFTKIGGRIMYELKNLIEWENRNTVEHTGQYRSK